MGKNKHKKIEKTTALQEKLAYPNWIAGTDKKEQKTTTPYKVFINEQCLKKLDWITNCFEYEMQAWLGGEIINNEIIIDDLMLSHHTAGFADVKVTSKELIEMRKEYGNRCTRIVGQFHSHNKLGCFWSITDATMQEKFLMNSSKDFCLFIVGSKKEYLTRMILKKPFLIILDDVELEPKLEYNAELEAFKKEVETKVTIQKHKIIEPIYGNYWKKQQKKYSEDEYDITRIGEEKETKKTGGFDYYDYYNYRF